MVEIGRQGAETCVRRGGQKRAKEATFQYGESLQITRCRGAGGTYADIELGALPSSSPFRSSTSSARRSPSTASASSFAHKLFCRPSRDELVLRAESPAARPSWGVVPAASIARRRRSRSCHGRRAREAAPCSAEAQKAP